MDVDPRYKHIEKIRGGVQWYMVESKGSISSINFKLENEKGFFSIFQRSIINIYFIYQKK